MVKLYFVLMEYFQIQVLRNGLHVHVFYEITVSTSKFKPTVVLSTGSLLYIWENLKQKEV